MRCYKRVSHSSIIRDKNTYACLFAEWSFLEKINPFPTVFLLIPSLVAMSSLVMPRAFSSLILGERIW